MTPVRSNQSRWVSWGLGSANYWFTFVTDPLTIVFFVLWELYVLRTNIWLLTLSYLAGVAVWTLVEYVFHRYVYHKGQTAAKAGHMIHHQSPDTLIAMPWFVVTAAFGTFWYVAAVLLKIPFVITVAAGLLSGFVFYGVFHHLLHHFEFHGRWYRRMRAHHFIHHRLPNMNFGVTSRFWDQVFRTSHRLNGSRHAQP